MVGERKSRAGRRTMADLALSWTPRRPTCPGEARTGAPPTRLGGDGSRSAAVTIAFASSPRWESNPPAQSRRWLSEASYTGRVAATDRDDRLVLTGTLARWITERATAEGRTEADVVAEALAVRWGRELGEAYRHLWDAREPLDEAEADQLVERGALQTP